MEHHIPYGRREAQFQVVDDKDGFVRRSTVRERIPLQKLPRLPAEVSDEVQDRYGIGGRMAAIVASEKASVRAAKLAADDAEMDLLKEIGHRHRRGELSQRDLYRIYVSLRSTGRRGLATRWDSVIDFKRLLIEHQQFNEPHTDGRWYGPWPVYTGLSLPAPGQAVVYYLYASNSECCYIGSSGNLKNRLIGHKTDGKIFESWMAEPHPTREAAYEAEDSILRLMDPLPRYNSKAGR